jgi:hypothetical protein
MIVYSTELYPVFLIATKEWHFRYSSEIDVTDKEEEWVKGVLENFEKVQIFISKKLNEGE